MSNEVNNENVTSENELINDVSVVDNVIDNQVTDSQNHYVDFPLVEINHLTKKYGKNIAIDDLSLTLNGGRIVGLLGPNGSGKTTLMKILVGLITDYQGEVTIDGAAIGSHTKALVSYLSDEPYFPNWMKIRDAIIVYQDFYHDFDTEKCLFMLKDMGLNPNMQIKKLSKGMNEKFLLALCMCRKAMIYVLDEPIAGVDPAAREYILDTILTNYNENGLILISTHLVTDIERIFDEVVFIKEGQVVLHQNAEELREERNKSIDELFIEVFRNA